MRHCRTRDCASTRTISAPMRRAASGGRFDELVSGTADPALPTGPRVGLTAGKVLGKAHERNRIKRRMRESLRRHRRPAARRAAT